MTRASTSTNDVAEQERCYAHVAAQALKSWSGSIEHGTEYQRAVEALAGTVDRLIGSCDTARPVAGRCSWCGSDGSDDSRGSDD